MFKGQDIKKKTGEVQGGACNFRTSYKYMEVQFSVFGCAHRQVLLCFAKKQYDSRFKKEVLSLGNNHDYEHKHTMFTTYN